MKIRNKKVLPPKPVNVIIYREDDNGNPANIEFVCSAVLNYDEFNKLCPTPQPPLVSKISTGEQRVDTKDRRYQFAINKWSDLRVDWMMIQSLRQTPDFEWEVVKYDDPETWAAYESELKEVLTENEYTRLINGIVNSNSPSQNRRQEAIDRFTPTQEQQEASEETSPVGEPTSTQSSEPVNG